MADEASDVTPGRRTGACGIRLKLFQLIKTPVPKKACIPASNAGKKLIEEYQEINYFN
jgi:hypothetical protein